VTKANANYSFGLSVCLTPFSPRHPLTLSPLKSLHPLTLKSLFTFKRFQSTMNTQKLSTFKLIIKVIAAIATAVLGVIAGKGLGDED
jgi:hypothetical protein